MGSLSHIESENNMNENQNNGRCADNAIDFKNLIKVVWKYKIIIVCLALFIAALAGLYSMFSTSPVYTAKLSLVANMPETYETKYGVYTLPETTNEQYINFITSNDILSKTLTDTGCDKKGSTVDSLKRDILISSYSEADSEKIFFDVYVSAGSLSDAKNLAASLYDNYIEYMDAMTLNNILSYFENDFAFNLKQLEIELEKNKEALRYDEELLKTTPQVIDQNEAMSIAKGQSGNVIVLQNVINPNYTRVQDDIITAKQEINSLEYSIQENNVSIDEIKSEMSKVNQYYETGDTTVLEENDIDMITTNIYLASDSTVSGQKTTPIILENAFIGAFLGGMLGVLLAFMKEYLFKRKV